MNNAMIYFIHVDALPVRRIPIFSVCRLFTFATELLYFELSQIKMSC